MDNLIKELVSEFKKDEQKYEDESKKNNKENKIVAKVNKNDCVEVLEVSGRQPALLASICLILKEMGKHSDDTALDMAKIILLTLEIEKEIND